MQSTASKRSTSQKPSTFAEMRVKLGDIREDDAELPSQIADDEWAEIQRFQSVKLRLI